MFLKFDMKNWKNDVDAAIRYACQLAKGEQTNITAEINGVCITAHPWSSYESVRADYDYKIRLENNSTAAQQKTQKVK